MIFRTILCWVRNAMLRKLTLSEFIGFLAPRPRELAENITTAPFVFYLLCRLTTLLCTCNLINTVRAVCVQIALADERISKLRLLQAPSTSASTTASTPHHLVMCRF